MLLDVKNLSISFQTNGGLLPVVREITWSVPQGKTVALVGESGCGKSVTAQSILQLLNPRHTKVTGQIIFENQNLLALNEREIRAVRGRKIAMIFQDPMSALNPVLSVGEQLMESIQLHQQKSYQEARLLAIQLLNRVEIRHASDCLRRYPHQLSGGMRQRVMMAIALAGRPSLLIADEPTTALDVTVQSQILRLLSDIQATSGMSLILITHDLEIVSSLTHHLYVMYAGRIVESGPTRELLRNPLHPYTQGLLRCVPRLGFPQNRFCSIPGQAPHFGQLPSGCSFHPRCQLTRQQAALTNRRTIEEEPESIQIIDQCAYSTPHLRELFPGHFVACDVRTA